MAPMIPRISAVIIPQAILNRVSVSIEKYDLAQAPSALTSLPPEIIAQVFESADILSAINLVLTCKQLARLVQVNRLLSFDTSRGSKSRERVLNDPFVDFGISTKSYTFKEDPTNLPFDAWYKRYALPLRMVPNLL